QLRTGRNHALAQRAREKPGQLAAPPLEKPRQGPGAIAGNETAPVFVDGALVHRSSTLSRQRSTRKGRPRWSPPSSIVACTSLQVPVSSVARERMLKVRPPPCKLTIVPSGSISACWS